MTYRSRNSKLTRDGSEIIMESIKFRIQYDKSFIINERYLPRKLKLYNNSLRCPKDDFLNAISESNQNGFSNSFDFATKQNLNNASLKSSNAILLPDKITTDEYYMPTKRLNKILKSNKASEFLKSSNQSNQEFPFLNESLIPSKSLFQSLKKKENKLRLRNLLDDGTDTSNGLQSNEKLSAFVMPENFQDKLFYLSENSDERQLKQIETYKDFKSKLGFSFSRRRLPMATINSAPNFIVRPLSRQGRKQEEKHN